MAINRTRSERTTVMVGCTPAQVSGLAWGMLTAFAAGGCSALISFSLGFSNRLALTCILLVVFMCTYLSTRVHDLATAGSIGDGRYDAEMADYMACGDLAAWPATLGTCLAVRVWVPKSCRWNRRLNRALPGPGAYSAQYTATALPRALTGACMRSSRRRLWPLLGCSPVWCSVGSRPTPAVERLGNCWHAESSDDGHPKPFPCRAALVAGMRSAFCKHGCDDLQVLVLESLGWGTTFK